MDFQTCFNTYPAILMEGAIGERLKREYNIAFDEKVAMAGLVYNDYAKQAMRNVFGEYVSIAGKYQLPFIATTPTRRANAENVLQSAFDEKIIGDNVHFMQEIRSTAKTEMFIGGLMGCRGDAYKATGVLSVDDAKEFHLWQAHLFREAGADFLYAGIMPALSEATGMAMAMESTGLPYIISFMIKKDGRLIDGTTIHDAIYIIDHAVSRRPVCYMTNCVHPVVLHEALSNPFNKTKLVNDRFRGIQANTSSLPPEELDQCCELKSADCVSLACDMMALYNDFTPKIFGGCCGTDSTHMEEIAIRLKDVRIYRGDGE